VIIEGVPLHLYVDIEGSKVTNPHIDFVSLFSRIIAELKIFLIAMCIAPEESLESMNIIILDSSTKDKFSKHLVLKIPDHLFKDNYICGALMRNFHVHLIRKFGSSENNPFYLVPEESAKSNNRVCVVDFAV